jgi:hypothetical protein
LSPDQDGDSDGDSEGSSSDAPGLSAGLEACVVADGELDGLQAAIAKAPVASNASRIRFSMRIEASKRGNRRWAP